MEHLVDSALEILEQPHPDFVRWGTCLVLGAVRLFFGVEEVEFSPGLKWTALPGVMVTSAPVRVADAGFARAHVENAETTQFYAITCRESLLQA